MPRINLNEADSYSGSNVFLSLADDGDYEEVTVLANTVDDIPIYATHRLELGKYEAKVNCLRQPNEPPSVCPLCAHGMNTRVNVELILLTPQGVKVFERGKRFLPKLMRWSKQYPLLCKPVFELVRVGKAGDVATTYEFEKTGENAKIHDWHELASDEEVNAVLKQVIREWTYEDMEEFLATGRDPYDTAPAGMPRKNKNTEFVARKGTAPRPARHQHNDNVDVDEGYDDEPSPERVRPNSTRRAEVSASRGRQAPASRDVSGDEEF